MRVPRRHILDGYGGDRKAFYASGETHVNDLRHALKKFGLPDLHGVGVEIGCGVGRMSIWLAGYFQHLYALDVSANMIALCPPHPNISYRAAAVIPPEIVDCDFVVSHLVFQHMPKAAFYNYMAQSWRALKIGGILHAQMNFSVTGYDFPETETLRCRGYDVLELEQNLPDERWQRIAVLRQDGLSEPWHWLTLRKL